ncbi:hypothetical protein KLP40_09590 [Hymenobacter sp. NST-14]|uniref:hypothetical protein n=1 Tax=Hymenobacter piscis TaxID=2839984 RepID=UPI001C02105C|nr:hypothetical protein [Hymenobacter piscis]MBT9393415.1 hypothetical protein [Hymenobacter piscis]
MLLLRAVNIALLAVPASLLTVGCSVYVPLLPAAPQLREKGQVEVQANSYFNRRWEAGATYSPAKYVLVRAAAGIRTSPNRRADSARYESSRQYELAAGGYLPLGRNGLVSGLAGFGQARSASAYNEGGVIRPQEYNDFRARYHRRFAELAASYFFPGRRSGLTVGVAYRLSGVRFEELTYNGQPVDVRRLTRHETMAFCRFGSPESAVPWLQGQLALGASTEPRRAFDPTRTYAEARVRAGIPYLALSLIVLPHLFRPAPSELPR